VRGARHAEDLADEDRHPGRSRLVDGGQRPRAPADGAGPLGLDPDDETGLVHEVDHREVEGVGEVHEAGELVGGVGGEAAAVDTRVGGDHRDGVAVEPGQPHDGRAAEAAAHLEQRAAVDHEADELSHVVRLAPAAGHDLAQLGLAPAGIVVGRPPRRRLPGACRQVGEEATDLRQRVGLRLGQVVDGAGLAGVDLPAAQLLLVHVLAHALLDHRRAGHEQLRGVADHHGEVGADHAGGAQPGNRPQAGGGDGDLGEVVDHQVPAGVGGHVGPPGRLVRLHAAAAAGAVHQPHQGQAQLVGQALRVDLLLRDGGVGGAAPHGEVVAAHHHSTAVDAARADHAVGRQEAGQRAVLVRGESGQAAVLLEGARIQQQLHALAHGQLAGVALSGDALRAAHPLRQLLAAAHLVQLGLPGHGTDYR
jgi:hypothetical protein